MEKGTQGLGSGSCGGKKLSFLNPAVLPKSTQPFRSPPGFRALGKEGSKEGNLIKDLAVGNG